MINYDYINDLYEVWLNNRLKGRFKTHQIANQYLDALLMRRMQS